jgi:hypothetical protein
VELIRPLFNTLSGKELDIAYLNPELLLSVLVIMIISGLLSGLYPAVYMSSFLPALLISWLTVLYQAVVTANKNPVNSLRYE